MKMSSRLAGTFLLLAACLLQPAVGSAVTLGQIDDFQDGTFQNWGIGNIFGNPVPPVNVPDGGPAGAGDHYLLLTADGGAGVRPDPGSRLAVINQTQWTGNYLAAGVNAITMSVNNLGATDLSLRLYVADGTIGTAPQYRDFNQSGILCRPAAVGLRWYSPSPPPILPPCGGNVQTALTNAKELRIFHNPAASFPGPRW